MSFDPRTTGLPWGHLFKERTCVSTKWFETS
jgi:hypothetical protein